MTVGEKIRFYRKKSNMTQKELGLRCGIGESMIRRYELGKRNPKYQTVEKIAQALNISIDSIITSEQKEYHQVNNALKGLLSILEYTYDSVDLKWAIEYDCDGVPECDGDFTVFLQQEKGEELSLTQKEFEILFSFIKQNIPAYIELIKKAE